ncbi:hypothetical protein GH714_016726 [Hevea brasiliensis]|uniref:Retrotransposon gag domain-containing protein n=1 Tax=Hevea brasiliensis TaxID=3981 RepID=A0A6A6NI10_HEVBR|nr:hypothetical protein GH714_016726 [Hevea brasiliensis]
MRLEQEQRMTSFQQEQEQRFNKLESMIASLARGKSTFLEGDSSSQATPGSTFQTIPPAANALVVEEFPMAVKKIELPNFDRVDPVGWLARAEQYFLINKTTDEMKVQLALICMEGPALHWMRWLCQRTPNISWSQLTLELLQRYGGDMRANPYERWKD